VHLAHELDGVSGRASDLDAQLVFECALARVRRLDVALIEFL
jgi:hypothetical protein